MVSEFSISETLVESLYFVNPADTNPLGILHGGNLMNWMVSTATLAATRVTRGNVLLGSLDSVFFIHPIHVGDMVSIKAWVEYIGRSSLEVGVRAKSENTMTHQTSVTTLSHMAFVAVDEYGEPRPVNAQISPKEEEKSVYLSAQKRWEERRKRLSDRRERSKDLSAYPTDTPFKMSFSRIVMSDDTIYGNMMFGGKLLKLLDEFTGALATKYCSGTVVTGAVDDMSFYHPIRVGNVIDITVALNYVGRSSLELGAKVFCEDPFSGNRHHAATCYYTFVHIDQNGKPAPVPPYQPTRPLEKQRWKEAELRVEKRKQLVQALKSMLEQGSLLLE